MMLLPDPVGVLTMTFDPDSASSSASSWAGYRRRPCSPAQPTNASSTASGDGGAALPRSSRSSRVSIGPKAPFFSDFRPHSGRKSEKNERRSADQVVDHAEPE